MARSHTTIAITAGGLTVLAVGALFLILGLENADRISSGVGAAAGVIGLVLTVLGAVRARSAQSADPPSGQKTIALEALASDQAEIYQVGEGTMNIENGR